MANLYYPQLTTGALAQYPIQKIRATRTIKNVMPDGTMVLYSDQSADRLIWALAYEELSSTDLGALQAHFAACLGPLRAFTFIDPTDNMLAWSADLTQPSWTTSTLLTLSQGDDPNGGTGAFVISNVGQSDQAISQTLQVPGRYQYCFSAYVTSASASSVSLVRSGAHDQQVDVLPVTPNWTRVTSSGRLDDAGTTLTVGILVPAGQQVQVYGVQLEAQVRPSGYRATGQLGGVYPTSHWLNTELIVTAEAPDLFSTTVSIETSI